MREKLFATLDVFHDRDTARSAALNMAIDEALLENATQPTIRFYQWDHPALSFGFGGKFEDVKDFAAERDLVRRWTGGGIVLHGEDLTYALAIPASHPAFSNPSIEIYEVVHGAISDALLATGTKAKLAAAKSEKISESCFANPVRADVMVDGRKIAGAAQRRTKRGLLQQGSIQAIELPSGFQMRFVTQLSNQTASRSLAAAILRRAQIIADEKYASADWLRKR